MSTGSSPSHRTDVQGLRAVAVLLVAAAHARVGVLSGGFVGVDVFFVLSGFLITSLLLGEARASGAVSLLDFYLRRARRILPAAALTLVVTDIAAYLLLNFVRAREVIDDSLHAAAFTANLRFAAENLDYFSRSAPPSPLLHYWSLSVEEQFYVVWPLLLMLALFGLRRRGLRPVRVRALLCVVVLLTAASFAWSVRLTAAAPAAAYFSPFARAWELGLGATLAVAAPTLARVPQLAKTVGGWTGLGAIAVAAVAYSEQTPFPGSAALLPTLGTALVVAAGMHKGTSRLAVARLLSLAPLRVVGDRSYAFYLWHWPVLILAADYAGHELPVAANLALLAGAFALSCLSYALLENPIRLRVRRRRTGVIVVLASATAILCTATTAIAGLAREERQVEERLAAPRTSAVGGDLVAARDRVSTRVPAAGVLPAVVASVEAARRGEPIPAGIEPPIRELKGLAPPYVPPAGCIGNDTQSAVASAICRVGDVHSRKLIVLMGDSHAMMWLPAVIEMARRDHLAVVPLLRLGCIPGRWGSSAEGGGCHDWYRWALDEIRRLRPEATLLGASIDERGTPSAEVALEAVVQAAADLHRIGSVAVIGDPEAQNLDPVDCLLSRHASMAACTTTWPARSLAGYDTVRRRVTQLGAGFVATRGFVCYQRSCPVIVGNTIAWIDDNHLSSAYSAELGGAFRAAFHRAFATASGG